MSSIKGSLTEAMKDAMRRQEKDRLGTIRLMLSACKQIEVDERIELDDTRVLSILDKMLKQRRDSIQQFEAGRRQDLADKEKAEMVVIQAFMPAALSEAEIRTAITQTIQALQAKGIQDMGKVMAQLKLTLQGRADMGKVGALVKELLAV
jgi:uncharacterized protein YqeY